MKVVLVKEKGHIGILEGEGEISNVALSLRSRLTAGEVKYYVLDYDVSLGMRLEAYVAALNKCPELLGKSKMIKEVI